MARQQCPNEKCGYANNPASARYCQRCGATLGEAAKGDAGVKPVTEEMLDDIEKSAVPEDAAPEDVEVPPPEPAEADEEEAVPADNPEAPPVAAPESPSFVLRVLGGPHAGAEVTVAPGGTVRVGASRDADLSLSSDDLVSRDHARVQIWDGQLLLTDLNSTNGTLLRVSRPAPVFAGDMLVIGRSVISVERR